MTEAVVEFVRRVPEAILPKKNLPSDSGFDLYSIEDVVIQPGHRKIVSTGWDVNPGEGWECQIRPTSGNAYKKGLTVLNTPGTIDGTYTGELKVILINLDAMPVHVYKGDKIAQMVVCPVVDAKVVQVSFFTRVNERGIAGFGSSGIVGDNA
jgi:dUTP pyrophosphatase